MRWYKLQALSTQTRCEYEKVLILKGRIPIQDESRTWDMLISITCKQLYVLGVFQENWRREKIPVQVWQKAKTIRKQTHDYHHPVHLDSGVDVVKHQEEMKCPCDHGMQHWSFMSWAPGVELSKRIEDKEKKFAVQEWQEANPSRSRPISMIISIIKGGTWIQVLMLWCRIKKWNAPVMMMGRCSSRSNMSWAPCVELSKRIEDEKKLQCKNTRKQTPQKTDRNHQHHHHTGHLASGVVMQHQEEMKWKFPLWWWMRCSSCFSNLELLLLLLCVFSKHWKIPSFYLSFCIPELLLPSHCCNLRTSKIVRESTGGSSSLKIDR